MGGNGVKDEMRLEEGAIETEIETSMTEIEIVVHEMMVNDMNDELEVVHVRLGGKGIEIVDADT